MESWFEWTFSGIYLKLHCSYWEVVCIVILFAYFLTYLTFLFHQLQRFLKIFFWTCSDSCGSWCSRRKQQSSVEINFYVLFSFTVNTARRCLWYEELHFFSVFIKPMFRNLPFFLFLLLLVRISPPASFPLLLRWSSFPKRTGSVTSQCRETWEASLCASVLSTKSFSSFFYYPYLLN